MRNDLFSNLSVNFYGHVLGPPPFWLCPSCSQSTHASLALLQWTSSLSKPHMYSRKRKWLYEKGSDRALHLIFVFCFNRIHSCKVQVSTFRVKVQLLRNLEIYLCFRDSSAGLLLPNTLPGPGRGSFQPKSISEMCSDCLHYNLSPFNYLAQHAGPVAAATGVQTPPGWEMVRGTMWGGLWRWKTAHQWRSLYTEWHRLSLERTWEDKESREEGEGRRGGAREGQRIRIEWKEEGDRQLGRVPEEEMCDLCCNPRNGPKR